MDKKILFFFGLLFLFSTTTLAGQGLSDSAAEVIEPMPDSAAADRIANDAADSTRGHRSDTTVYFSDAKVSTDSVEKWRREFTSVKGLDSSLARWQRQRLAEGGNALKAASWAARLLMNPVTVYLMWTLAALAIIYIIYRFVLSRGPISFRRSRSGATEEIPEDEKMMLSDFRPLIASAESDGNYRLAVRYRFLKLLQSLSQRQLIQFQHEKTNYQYRMELPADRRKDFSMLSAVYEAVWYGRMPLGAESYARAQEAFNSFDKTPVQ